MDEKISIMHDGSLQDFFFFELYWCEGKLRCIRKSYCSKKFNQGKN